MQPSGANHSYNFFGLYLSVCLTLLFSKQRKLMPHKHTTQKQVFQIFPENACFKAKLDNIKQIS